MKKNIFFGSFFYILVAVVLLTSCQKQDSPWKTTDMVPTENFSGSVIEYLRQKGGYDSMLLVIEKYEDIKTSLTNGDEKTVFAIPNSSFEHAIKGFNEMRASLDSVPLYITPYDLSRSDSGVFQFDVLKTMISMYIFNGHYDYVELAGSSTGLNVNSIGGYQMNMKAIGESAVGSVGVGPKRIQLSDMNYSPFTEYWKSVVTISVSTVLANNVLVHTLSNDHQFGFSTFNQKLAFPAINRQDWKPIKWISTNPDRIYGGTVFHAIDNDPSTEWRSFMGEPRPPLTRKPWWFIIDMGKEYEVGGFSVQHRSDMTIPPAGWGKNFTYMINYVPDNINIEFARDTATNLDDPASWYKKSATVFIPMNYSGYFLRNSFRFDEKVTGRYFKLNVVRNWHGNSLGIDGTEFTRLGEIWMDY